MGKGDVNHKDERNEGTKYTHIGLIEAVGALDGDGDVTAPLYDNTTFPPVSVCACNGLLNTTCAASAGDARDDTFLHFRRE
jgi:hypothetical protein